MRKGLIQVYTGKGKGKTTAALGLALRARSHSFKVCFIYFHKDAKKWKSAEHKILKKIGVHVFAFARKHPCFYKNVNREAARKDCLSGLNFIKKIFKQNRYDLLILDEINISVRDKFLKEKEVIEILKIKPAKLELVLTGRGASKAIIKKADLVSEMKEVRHPYNLGFLSRKGIEY